MDIYVAEKDGMREMLDGMMAEELEDVGDACEFDEETLAERRVEAAPEFIEAQEEDGPELKLDGDINSVQQDIAEKFGGYPSDWHRTYTESSNQFFDGEKLIDQEGVSIEGLIPEDRLAQYQELIETWKDNAHEVQHLEWWERTDEGEILHVTSLSLGENGEVLSETWSHTIEGIVAAPDNDLEFVAETFADIAPEEPEFPRAKDADPDPRILDLTAYLEANQPTEEILDDTPQLADGEVPYEDAKIVELPRVLAAHTAPRSEGDLVSSELITSTASLDGQHGSVTKERPAEIITPAADTVKPHKEILESKAHVPEIAKPIQAPEVVMRPQRPAARVNTPDVVVFDKGSESRSGNASEDVVVVPDAPLEILIKEREKPEQALLEVVPPEAIKKNIASEYMLDVPKTADVKDSVPEEESALPQEIVSLDELAREIRPHQESETVTPRSEDMAVLNTPREVSTEERGELNAVIGIKSEPILVPLEAVPFKIIEQSIVDEHIFVKPEPKQTPLEVAPPKTSEQSIAGERIFTAPETTDIRDSVREVVLRADEVTPEKVALPQESVSRPAAPELSLKGVDSARAQKLDAAMQAKKTEVRKKEPAKDAAEVSPQPVDKASETKFQDLEVADTDLIDAAHDTREDEPDRILSYDDESEDPASAPPVVLGRREILLRSFGLTSEEIRRYQGERKDSPRFARTRGANNAPIPTRVSGITRAQDRRNGISLLRSAA